MDNKGETFTTLYSIVLLLRHSSEELNVNLLTHICLGFNQIRINPSLQKCTFHLT